MAEKPVTTLKPPFEPCSIPPEPPASFTASHASLTAANDGPQPVLDSPSTLPLTALDSLPTIAGKRNGCFLVEDDIEGFITDDLDLGRLNRIHTHLWMAGRPLRARPLHRYQMMSFQVLYTQQMDLHLLQFSNRLLLKPLPEWLLDYEFWEKYICPHPDLHESAWGFLLSYVWLITTPLDLRMAHEHFLLPSFVTWHWWKKFVKNFCGKTDMETLDGINKRYHFGDLRLGRINSIYRILFMSTHFVRGYLYGYNRYVVFFQRNFSWIVTVFVFFSLLLSAMQVGVGVAPLDSNEAFLRVSYGFVVFSMVACMVVLALVGIIFVVIFFFNMGSAISHVKKAAQSRKQRRRERKLEQGTSNTTGFDADS
ncbi:hypothetical protein K504DRAFT_28609 [Pleomassaria siparia CBS 279.74]|uniref:Uncharacterized protein n=1 Tax=Pleomassaria siparia CBS 279.74 TaxID=1314801 RepID=A0A6G1KRQ2_9PLEO|nr:hypothetical protein K504DRAFT_28609 [Pleomassaria siparia CBS 279.74]